MRTSKWSMFKSGSNQTQWSVCGKTVGRKSKQRKRPKKTQWSIGGEASNQRQWSIGEPAE